MPIREKPTNGYIITRSANGDMEHLPVKARNEASFVQAVISLAERVEPVLGVVIQPGDAEIFALETPRHRPGRRA